MTVIILIAAANRVWQEGNTEHILLGWRVKKQSDRENRTL